RTLSSIEPREHQSTSQYATGPLATGRAGQSDRGRLSPLLKHHRGEWRNGRATRRDPDPMDNMASELFPDALYGGSPWSGEHMISVTYSGAAPAVCHRDQSSVADYTPGCESLLRIM